MPEHPPGTPPRTRPRLVWFDPRFGIGLALVVASVIGVSLLVSSMAASDTVLAARHSLAEGTRVTADDFIAVAVRRGGVARLYVQSGRLPKAGAILTHSIAAGELLPDSAVASVAESDRSSVVVPLSSGVPATIGVGSRVQLWSAAPTDGTHFDTPHTIVDTAVVARIVLPDSPLDVAKGTSVELVIPRDNTAAVLQAIASGAAMSIVPLDVHVGG
ncbi:hypothetical protein [Galbitalea soli]|uniref:SAF domain-containing protein n=1 Tax=Galbitalea soli TaxID=1268042 RepID=A0A7C9TPK2_9MICO|nr:hypothetical protein [Galbitalea soli]NEM90817.1 hypothetical protein [Galbitalea soli]NYJ31536.1 hypothetical protein [Galbitalea soli]